MSKNIEQILKDQRVKANELREKSKYSNVCFVAHDGRVQADKSYLCTFDWRYKEYLSNSEKCGIIELDKLDLQINRNEMNQIIAFIYTGKFDFSNNDFSTIIRFHQISVVLRIVYLTEYLEQHILNNFQDNKRKCTNLWNHARNMGLRKWENQVLDYVARNAKEFLAEDFVLLDRQQYFELLKHKRFELEDDTVCRYLLEWLDYDQSNRRFDIEELFKKVDFRNLDKETLRILIKRSDSFLNKEICKALLLEVESKENLREVDWDSASD